MSRSLSHLSLFKGMNTIEISRLLDVCRHSVKTYSKGEIIALKGARYHSLMILSQGSISAETTDREDAVLKKETIQAPSLITPTHLFAEDNRLPVNITARTAVHLILIAQDDFCTMMQKDQRVLKNFLEIISTPNSYISESVVYLTYKTIKGKFANYLLDRIERHGSNSFRNDLTQREMAELFGVTRPALARAIGELVDEGTIYVKGKDINVLFIEKLRHYAKY